MRAQIQMFELNRQEICFQSSPNNIYTDMLTLRNTHQQISYAYKIKTTNPELFEVTPSKGVLNPAQFKNVDFKTKRIMSKDEISAIDNKEKFLIQYFELASNDKKKQQQIQEMWNRAKEDPKDIHYIKLRVRFNEPNISDTNIIKSTVPIVKPPTPLKRTQIKDQNFKSIAQQESSNLRTIESKVISFDASTSNYNNDLNNRLQQLKQKELRLEQERKDIYQRLIGKENKKGSSTRTGHTVLLFILFALIGLIGKKYIYDLYLNTPKTIPSPPRAGEA